MNTITDYLKDLAAMASISLFIASGSYLLDILTVA